MKQQDVKGIIDFTHESLPKNSGDNIIVRSIGFIALSKEYTVELLTGTQLYKITKN